MNNGLVHVDEAVGFFRPCWSWPRCHRGTLPAEVRRGKCLRLLDRDATLLISLDDGTGVDARYGVAFGWVDDQGREGTVGTHAEIGAGDLLVADTTLRAGTLVHVQTPFPSAPRS